VIGWRNQPLLKFRIQQEKDSRILGNRPVISGCSLFLHLMLRSSSETRFSGVGKIPQGRSLMISYMMLLSPIDQKCNLLKPFEVLLDSNHPARVKLNLRLHPSNKHFCRVVKRICISVTKYN